MKNARVEVEKEELGADRGPGWLRVNLKGTKTR